MDQNPYMAPQRHKVLRKLPRNRPSNDAAFFFFIAIAVFFGVPGIFAGLSSVLMLVIGTMGAKIGSDVTPFQASLMLAIGAAPSLAVGAIAWAIARGFCD